MRCTGCLSLIIYFQFACFGGKDLYSYQPIPDADFVIPHVEFNTVNEPLVDVTEFSSGKILFEPVYYNSGIPGAINKCYAREEVAKRLCAAAEKLPEGMSLKIFDAWRPFDVQRALYERYRRKVASENKTLSAERIDELTQRFVSIPKKDMLESPVHSTGGAVDLTIVDARGQELDMGTEFDSFDQASNTVYFENAGSGYEKVRDNRRFLYGLMTGLGFTNLPTEWWHFDFGDRFWAHYSNSAAIYTGIFQTGDVENEK